MPTKRIFDLTVLTILLTKPAFGLAKMAARRWSAQYPEGSALETVGDAIQVAL